MNELYPPNDHAFFYDETERVYRDEFRRASGASMVVNWSTTTSYDGLETVVTSPEGRQARSTNDVFGQTIATTQLNTAGTAYSTTTNSYTFSGQLDASTDHDGNIRDYGYDHLGRLITSSDPDQGSMSFTYDNNGNQKTSTDAVGNIVYTNYDALNRPTSRRVGATGTGVYLAEWTYYTTGSYKGQPKDIIGYGPNATTTAGVDSYTTTFNTYDNAYRPTQKTYDFPNAGVGLTGPFVFNYTYNEDNSVKTVVYPMIGSLSAETLTPTYHAETGQPDRLDSNYGGPSSYLVRDTTYTADGMLATRVLHKSTELQVTRSYTYSTNTRRLVSLKAVTDTSTTGSPRPTSTIQEDVFAYDDDNNVTRITDPHAGGIGQRQCFKIDHYNRLERAWTQTDDTDCLYDTDGNPATTADNPAPDGTGPSPYDHTYSYATADGGRTGNISEYDTRVWPGGTVTNHDLTYTEATGGPHAPDGVDGGTYTYLANGNMSSSTIGGVVSIFGYTPEGRLSVIGESTGQSTNMVYDPSGQRRLRKIDNPGTANDEATLYIEGHELKATYNSTGELQNSQATRYYTSGGATIGLRNNSGLTWILGNHQGSASVSILANQTIAITQRYEPFGKVRGATNQLPTDRDFLGQIQDDSTSLNYLNARYYDPNLLHFISVDPIVIKTHEAYGYANNNPATNSDPSGLCTKGNPRAPDACKNNSQPKPSGGGNPTCGDPEFIGPCPAGGTGGDTDVVDSNEDELLDALDAAGISSDALEKLAPNLGSQEVQIVRIDIREQRVFIATDGVTTIVFSETSGGTLIVATGSPTSLRKFGKALGRAAGPVGVALTAYELHGAFMEGWNATEGESTQTRVVAGLQSMSPEAIRASIDAAAFAAGAAACSPATPIASVVCGLAAVLTAELVLYAFTLPEAPPSFCREGVFEGEEHADRMGFFHAPERNGGCP